MISSRLASPAPTMVALCRLVLGVLSRMGASPARDERVIHAVVSAERQGDNALECRLQGMVGRAIRLSLESVAMSMGCSIASQKLYCIEIHHNA